MLSIDTNGRICNALHCCPQLAFDHRLNGLPLRILSKAVQPQIMSSLEFAGVLRSKMSAGTIKGLTSADQLMRLAMVIRSITTHLLSQQSQVSSRVAMIHWPVHWSLILVSGVTLVTLVTLVTSTLVACTVCTCDNVVKNPYTRGCPRTMQGIVQAMQAITTQVERVAAVQ